MGEVELLELHPGRAGRDDDAVDALVGDVLLDHLDGFGAAHDCMFFDKSEFCLPGRHLAQVGEIHGPPDATALAQIRRIFPFFHGYLLLRLMRLLRAAPVASSLDFMTSRGLFIEATAKTPSGRSSGMMKPSGV